MAVDVPERSVESNVFLYSKKRSSYKTHGFFWGGGFFAGLISEAGEAHQARLFLPALRLFD